MNNKKISFSENKEKIIKHLDKFPHIKCPICHEKRLTLLDWFINSTIEDELTSDIILWWNKTLPSVCIACWNCGHIMYFSAGVMWLLHNNSNKDENGK